jgi:hypothetical protein
VDVHDASCLAERLEKENKLRETVTPVPTVELSDQPSPMVITKPRHRHFQAELKRVGGIDRRSEMA